SQKDGGRCPPYEIGYIANESRAWFRKSPHSRTLRNATKRNSPQPNHAQNKKAATTLRSIIWSTETCRRFQIFLEPSSQRTPTSVDYNFPTANSFPQPKNYRFENDDLRASPPLLFKSKFWGLSSTLMRFCGFGPSS